MERHSYSNKRQQQQQRTAIHHDATTISKTPHGRTAERRTTTIRSLNLLMIRWREINSAYYYFYYYYYYYYYYYL
jgi:hypothetical protein